MGQRRNLGETTIATDDKIVDAFNDLIPDTGSGNVVIPVHVTSESAGIVVLERFSVTYSINTVNPTLQFQMERFSTKEQSLTR